MLSTSRTKLQNQYLMIALVMLVSISALVLAIMVYQAGVRPTISVGQAPAVVDLSWPPRPDFSFLAANAIIPNTGSTEGLAIYHQSEWAAPVTVQNSLDLYYLSERVEANPAFINQAGLAQYHLSERASYAVAQNGLDIYHQSEWNAAQGSAFHYSPPGR
jgi:hypothetical protein